MLGWQFRDELTGKKPDLLIAVVVSAVLFVILFFVLRRQNKEEPDEVLDGGTFLRVSYGSETEDIPISNLYAVETGKLLRLTKIALIFKPQSRFGEVIEFYPHQEKDASGQNAVAVSLQRRINGSRL